MLNPSRAITYQLYIYISLYIKPPLPALSLLSLLFEVLHLIEQQHAVRSSPDRLSELSTFLSKFSRVQIYSQHFPSWSLSIAYSSYSLPILDLQEMSAHISTARWPRSQHSLVELQSNGKLQTSPCTLTCPQEAPLRHWNITDIIPDSGGRIRYDAG